MELKIDLSLFVPGFVRNIYSDATQIEKKCGFISGAAAFEMTARTIKSLVEYRLHMYEEGCYEVYTQALRDKQFMRGIQLSQNLAHTLIYGLCAARIFPYAPRLGASLFLGMSFLQYGFDAYVQYFPARMLTTLGNQIAPLAKKIRNLAGKIIFVKIPNNPAWTAVALLLVAGVAYKCFDAFYLRQPKKEE